MITTKSLQKAIDAVRSLPVNDKLQLLQVILLDLQQSDQLEALQATFWENQSLDELLQQQSNPVITDIKSLTVGFWTEAESTDEFEKFITNSRQIDRTRQS
ncbi:hypothetical protein WJM97_20755 [Okeanomitos corallinicola TIOX110]|uniref:Uncharacterized protein n=1 Tax=Okeanomitos corallinicola TIOX110 TaxID=3133117 RepID=A0ABZ2US06_9CYAN